MVCVVKPTLILWSVACIVIGPVSCSVINLVASVLNVYGVVLAAQAHLSAFASRASICSSSMRDMRTPAIRVASSRASTHMPPVLGDS